MSYQLDQLQLSDTLKVGADASITASTGKVVANSIQLVTGGALGYVLTSDASGNASWAQDTAPTRISAAEFDKAGLTGLTLDDTHALVVAYDTDTDANASITLPAIGTDYQGKRYVIVNKLNGAFTVTLNASSTDYIGSGTATSLVLNTGDRVSILGGTPNSGGAGHATWLIGF